MKRPKTYWIRRADLYQLDNLQYDEARDIRVYRNCPSNFPYDDKDDYVEIISKGDYDDLKDKIKVDLAVLSKDL